MRARASMILAMTGLLIAGLSAQAKPNLSGEWTMVPEKSDFGRLSAPRNQVRTITHKEPTFKIVVVQSADATGDTTVPLTFTTDGTPQHNSFLGTPMTTVGRWENATVVFKSTRQTDQGDVAMEDRYSLRDGKTLVLTRSFNTPEGPVAQMIIFTKK